MTNKKFEAQSKRMHDLWNDESSRKELIASMRAAGKKRRKHTDITVRQGEDYRTYQREYQRKYRLAHPDYYNNRRATKKNYENDISEIKNTLKKMQEDIKRLEDYTMYENLQSCSVPATQACSEEELRINN